MLDTIRQLARQIKLKEMVLELFVPPDRCKALEDRTVWQDDKDAWSLEGSGRDARAAKRPTSAPGLRRPETEYARHRKQYDPNPRYKYDDIAVLELDRKKIVYQRHRRLAWTMCIHDEKTCELLHP